MFQWWSFFVAETRSITEPAGALALAGLKHHIVANNLIGAQKKFVAVISGANMNFDRLRFVAERAELGEGREALLSVEVPEKPGRCVLIGICHRSFTVSNIVSLHSTQSYILDPSLNLSIGTTHRTLHTSSSHSNLSPYHGQKKCRQCWMPFSKKGSEDLTLATTRWQRVIQDIWWGDALLCLTNVCLGLVGSESDLFTRVFICFQSSPNGLGPCASSWRAFTKDGISLCSIIATMAQVSRL